MSHRYFQIRKGNPERTERRFKAQGAEFCWVLTQELNLRSRLYPVCFFFLGHGNKKNSTMASQHYQPLSHALQHSLAQPPSVYPPYDQAQQIAPVQHAHQQLNDQRQEEEEDDEDDMADDDPPRSPIQSKSGGCVNTLL
jgi:hypothetical protein